MEAKTQDKDKGYMGMESTTLDMPEKFCNMVSHLDTRSHVDSFTDNFK